jgi:hypothetical protein
VFDSERPEGLGRVVTTTSEESGVFFYEMLKGLFKSTFFLTGSYEDEESNKSTTILFPGRADWTGATSVDGMLEDRSYLHSKD